MADLELTRTFAADQQRVFHAITDQASVLDWWGPEGFTTQSDQLSFTRTGPFVAVMISPDGNRYKVSGQVTHVTPPTSIGYTWAWHDEDDARGEESHVTITLAAAPGGGTTLTLNHRDLPTDELAASHESGWTSTLNKLEKLLAA